MYDVVVLSLTERGDAAGGVRAPVRACADALAGAGARVETVTAASDRAIDEVLARLPEVRLVVAAAVDGQLRAVVRRLVRRLAPPPSQRLGDGRGGGPAGLPENRTVPDLPPFAVLSLDPAGADLAGRLGLPRDPAAVASAALGDRVRRLDLLRQDGGLAVTLDGSLLGSSDEAGRAVPWRARVEVDDAVLTGGDEPLLAAVVANADGYLRPDELPLLTAADPADGVLEAAVAVPVWSRWRRRVRVEVRRARGRAAVVRPAGDPVAYLDDGVAGELTRQRSWWIEPAAWGVYT